MRIFTPTQELPFAGHPTLGTAAVLSAFEDAQIELRLKVGSVPVSVQKTDYGARAELLAPPATRVDGDVSSLAESVGLARDAIDTLLPIETWSSGNAFTMIPVRDLEALAKAHTSTRHAGWPLGIVAFVQTGSASVRARVFIPGDAVPEDPATGSANAPLATYLHAHGRLPLGVTLRTDQGIEMGRPSSLEARLERDASGDASGDVRARIAGGVVRVITGTLEL